MDRSLVHVGGHPQNMAQIERDMDAWARFYQRPISWGRHIKSVVAYWPLVWRAVAMRPRHVLEVGTGSGTLSIFLSRLIQDVVTADFSRGVLAVASQNNRRLLGRLKPVQADAFKLPFRDGYFDLAFSAGFFEHFTDQEIHKLLGEQLRVANRVLFAIPNANYGQQDFGNERLLPLARWEEMIKSFGFRVTSAQDFRLFTRRLWREPRSMSLLLVESSDVGER